MKQYCYLNGEVLSLDEAKISILDIGLLRGFSIYDGLTVVKGKPLHFKDHWNRFTQGANALNLKVPITEELLEKKIIEIVGKSGLTDRANIRLIVTGGETKGGIEYDFDKPTFYAVAEKWEPLPKEYYDTGATLVISEHMRELPLFKTTNYIEAVNLQKLRKEKGAVEILYIYEGAVLECATSNVFIVKDNILITPAEDILEGITRKIVMELAEGDYKIEKRKVLGEELKSADEVFITSSFKDIVPIIKIDDFSIADGIVGPVSRDLMAKFAKYIS